MSAEIPLVWSEIPVADMARAKRFYQEVLGLQTLCLSVSMSASAAPVVIPLALG
ncbi:VOC family protein [Shewanella carassii]|uniref:Glyoxalase/Bleomycin resistance-like N-terminal domain-containing protein n=1 Tax=Shewanella carassii TaxID=1987584 RepID=A0ABQ1T421_9GAMM|nr:VOC family protein [Shewanella carassii]GGE78297.1 hypothetical protein GCM10011520_18550 [Shewanella carassii]